MAVIAANGTYANPDGTSTAKSGNIGTLKARGTIAGKYTAANAIGTVTAGGTIAAQMTRGDGLSVVVDANNASIAASTPPVAPTADWLAGVLAESDALFATVLADAAALQTELTDWVNSLTATRSGIAATIALEKTTAADDLALLHSQLATSDAELLAMRASILSQIDGELSAAFAEARTANSVARSAAIQWFGDAQSAAILERALVAATIAASKVTAIQNRNLDRAVALLARSSELVDAEIDVSKLATERTTHATGLKVIYYHKTGCGGHRKLYCDSRSLTPKSARMVTRSVRLGELLLSGSSFSDLRVNR